MPLPITGAHESRAAAVDFVWFVYGSSLDRESFAAWAREHGYALPDFSRAVAARLEGWRLSFDVASRYWGGAVGSLASAPGATVEGLAVPMPGASRGLADHKEGAISGLYRPLEVRVSPLGGGAPITGIAYVASPERGLASEATPASAWLETVIRGARSAGLSPQWIAQLEGLRAATATTAGKVLSVNVGGPRELEYNGRPARSAIWKSPVSGRIAARGINLEGDDQADRKAHGGPDKAIYAYAVEDVRWWEQKIGRSLAHGEFGENLTTEGIEVNGALVGERWEIGTAVLEVSEPRVPCWRLGVRMDDATFPRRFSEALRPGTYLRIVVEGDMGAGDEIRVVEKPDHDLTIRDVFRIYTRDRDEVYRLVTIPGMSESWRSWARHLLDKAR